MIDKYHSHIFFGPLQKYILVHLCANSTADFIAYKLLLYCNSLFILFLSLITVIPVETAGVSRELIKRVPCPPPAFPISSQ